MKLNGLLTLAMLVVLAAVISSRASAAAAWSAPAPAAALVRAEESAKAVAYMGVGLDELTARAARSADYPHRTGVVVSSVETGSAADKAGIKENDIIYLFGGVKVDGASQLVSLVQKRMPGDKVDVTIYRDGDEKKLALVLGTREEPAIAGEAGGKGSDELARIILDVDAPALELYKRSVLMRGNLGMTLADLNDDLAPYFGVAPDAGALVLDVDEGSPAGEAGVKGGDILTSVNGAAVSDVSDVIDALSDLEPGDTASLGVIRKGTAKTFEVELARDETWYRLSTAPFERDRAAKEKLDRYLLERDRGDEAGLKAEMQALKERLKELEDRLDRAEKKE
jgi:S1-C subfamily serine protease